MPEKDYYEKEELLVRYIQILDNTHDIIFELDQNGLFTFISKAWEELLGHRIEDVLNRSFVPFVHPDDVKRCADFLHEVYATGLRKSGIRYRVKHLNGEWRWHTTNASVVKDASGNISRFIGIASDITELVHSENESEKLRKTLEFQNETLKNFAYTVSHNLNTHARHLDFVYQSINESGSAIKDDPYFSIFEKSIQSLKSTVEDLTDLVKVQATKEQLALKNIDIIGIVKRVLDGIGNTEKLDDIKIINKLPENSIYIKGIAAFVDSIVLNLVSNAIKYRKTIETCYIEINYFINDGYFKLSIQDNGIGIDLEKNKKHLFQLYKVFNNNQDARGIGLYIIKQQIEAIGGTIEVYSELGKGATFHVNFKLADPH